MIFLWSDDVESQLSETMDCLSIFVFLDLLSLEGLLIFPSRCGQTMNGFYEKVGLQLSFISK